MGEKRKETETEKRQEKQLMDFPVKREWQVMALYTILQNTVIFETEEEPEDDTLVCQTKVKDRAYEVISMQLL